MYVLFSIINPYHEDGEYSDLYVLESPSFVGLVCLLIWLAGIIKERLRVHHSGDQLVFQATILGLGLPPLRGLSLLSEKSASQAVYLETDRDGDDWSDAMVHGRSSEGGVNLISVVWLANWRNPRIHTTHPTKKRRER